MSAIISRPFRHLLVNLCAAPLAIAGLGCTASAQTAPPPAETVAPPAAKTTKPTPSKARECTRLPLSDIKGGKENTITSARLRLDEYISQVAQKKGWKAWDKSQETVECNEFLWVPIIGQEYKCLVTATFCKKS